MQRAETSHLTRHTYSLYEREKARELTMSLDPIVEVLQQYGSYVKHSILSMPHWLFTLRLPRLRHERLMMYADFHHASDAT